MNYCPMPSQRTIRRHRWAGLIDRLLILLRRRGRVSTLLSSLRYTVTLDLLRQGRRRVLPGTFLLTVAAACGIDEAPPANGAFIEARITVVDATPFSEAFSIMERVVLDEPPGVVTVSPGVSTDTNGDLLVTDSREHQVRVYSPSGRLLRVAGEGPVVAAPLRVPQNVVRLPTGELVVANLQGSLVIIPPDSTLEPRLVPLGLWTIRGLAHLGGDSVLLAGTDSSPPSATLFTVRLSEGRISRRFLPPPAHLDPNVTAFYSTVSIARRGDRIAAVHMVSDTLTILSADGREVSKVRIPLDPFVAPVGPLPDLPSERAQREWMAQFTIVIGVFWVADDQLIIQWNQLRPEGGLEWGLLRMDTTGTRLWAVAPAPRLMAVFGDQYLFVDPEASSPNQWLLARERLPAAVR